MSKKTQQVRAWKFLMEQCQNIQDPLLKKATIAEFRERALRDWGWDPVSGDLATQQPVELDDWEQDFMDRVQIAQQTGVFIPDSNVNKEARARMRQFIRDGGTLLDLPENLRTPEIIDLFYASLHEEGEDIIALVDYFIETHKKEHTHGTETHK